MNSFYCLLVWFFFASTQNIIEKSRIQETLNLWTHAYKQKYEYFFSYFFCLHIFSFLNLNIIKIFFFEGGLGLLSFRVSGLLSFRVSKLPGFQVSKFRSGSDGGTGTNERPGNWSCDLRANERPKKPASDGTNRHTMLVTCVRRHATRDIYWGWAWIC